MLSIFICYIARQLKYIFGPWNTLSTNFYNFFFRKALIISLFDFPRLISDTFWRDIFSKTGHISNCCMRKGIDLIVLWRWGRLAPFWSSNCLYLSFSSISLEQQLLVPVLKHWIGAAIAYTSCPFQALAWSTIRLYLSVSSIRAAIVCTYPQANAWG